MWDFLHSVTTVEVCISMGYKSFSKELTEEDDVLAGARQRQRGLSSLSRKMTGGRRRNSTFRARTNMVKNTKKSQYFLSGV